MPSPITDLFVSDKGDWNMEPRMTLNENVSHEDRQKGVTTVEYAVMLVLVAIAVLSFGAGFSSSITGVFNQLIAAL
jgi:Flp pilus assembly pilin Flp